MKFLKIFVVFFIVNLLIISSVTADDFVIEEDINDTSDNFIIETSSYDNSEISINSRRAVVFERRAGVVLYDKNMNEKCAMASTTKIMTSIIVIENTNLSDIVTISKKAASTGGSVLGIHTGDKISVNDLLYGLMLRSGNDTAVALAEYVGGSIEGFADLMNKKAQELNLSNTHFETPHGLDSDNHYTTAYELALITDYALKNETFCNIVKTQSYTVNINGNPKQISNTNELLGRLDGVYGVKTGFTGNAGRCLVTATKRNDLDIITVILGADTKKIRTNDSVKLINYCLNNFVMVNLEQEISKKFDEWKSLQKGKITIDKAVETDLSVYLSDLKYKIYPVKKDYINRITTYLTSVSKLNSPVVENQYIGEIRLYINNQFIESCQILNSKLINRKTNIYYFENFLKNYNNILEYIK